MLNWQVGRVKITRIVEMDFPVPAMLIPEATPAELRESAWLYPHFVSEDDTTVKLSVNTLLVEAPGLKRHRYGPNTSLRRASICPLCAPTTTLGHILRLSELRARLVNLAAATR